MEPEPEPEPATIQDVLDDLGDCEPLDGNERLNLRDGCVDGACVGMTFAQINAALDETGRCEPDEYTEFSTDCAWSNGVSTNFDDEDGDGQPDEGSVAYSWSLSAPYDGTSFDGLGVDAQMQCFLRGLGDPDSVSFYDMTGELVLYSMSWYEQGVFVYDIWGPNYGPPDGRVDWVFVAGGRDGS